MSARLKTEFWVQATLRRCLNGVVLRRGDADAGGVLAVLRSRQGLAIFSRVTDAEGEPAWLRAGGEAPLGEAEADAYVARQTQRDPDLWVIEVEAADLLPPFEGRVIT